MILEIPDLLSPQEVSQLKDVAAKAIFIDGRISNPHNQTKNNQQMDLKTDGYQQSSQLLMGALLRNEGFRNFTFPSRIAPPLVCRYFPEMSYGIHSDSAFLPVQGKPPLRSDVSMTIFLNDPETYDGGELTIHFETRPVSIKLPAGAAVVYPSTFLHEVTPVTRGERLVAITFIESQFSDERQRQLLYVLGEVEALEGFNIKHENRIRLAYVQQNLKRMWS